MVLPDSVRGLPDDSVDAHVADTLVAGAGLCDAEGGCAPSWPTALAQWPNWSVRERISNESSPGRWALTEKVATPRRIIHSGA